MSKRTVLITLAALAGLSLWRVIPPQSTQTNREQVLDQQTTDQSLTTSSSITSYQSNQAESSQDPGIWAVQGTEALALGHYAEAIQLLSQAAATDPTNTQLWMDMAYAYLALGNCDCAISRLNYVLQLDPQHAQAYWLRAQAYQQRGLAGDEKLALADARQALQLAPHNSQTHELVTVLENSALSNSISQWDPRNSLIDNQANQAAGRSHSTPVQTRLQAHPQSSRSHELRLLSQYIDRHPQVANGYLQRALYLWNESQVSTFNPSPASASAVTRLLQSVLRDLDVAIALDPHLALAYELRSYVHLQARNLDLALADLEVLGSLGFANGAWHQQRALVLFEMGSSYWHLALEHINHALMVAADANEFAEGHMLRARIFEGLGSWDLALADYTYALGIRPEADAYYHRGILTLQAGLNPVGALADLERALSLWQTTATGAWEDVMDAQQVRDALLGS
ncbi:MAG: tetratricopeptide repeat protein [Synechococcaceae cyanobacterium SM2_3_2]|nr:tetratricopeptide repeat protein [Synechococcaceae cyanobacterium SM2_3_2]